MSVILTTKGVTKSYRMGPNVLEVLRGVDFAVEAGEFVAMVGAEHIPAYPGGPGQP
jgi:ABC-type lipoprotein export system ATPase subunit